MVSTYLDKEQVKRELAAALGGQREVRRVIVFGSFVTEAAPHDVDVAIYQDSAENYLCLALKYRRITRAIAAHIALDIVPLRVGAPEGSFLREIERGEVIYERWCGCGSAMPNRQTARLTRERLLFNPCLQNCQQAVEKLLKALLIHLGQPVRRTHSINELTQKSHEAGAVVTLSDEDCDLLDSVYLPSKYPLGSALPLFEPDEHLCDRCLALVDSLAESVIRAVGGGE